MRFVVIPTFWLGQIADAYSYRGDAIEAATRGNGDYTVLEILGEATNRGQSVYKEFPQPPDQGTDKETTDDHS